MMCLLAVSTPTENLKVTKPFQQWMDDHANFRDICEEGKGKIISQLIEDNFPLKNKKNSPGKLQWERDIPQDALDNLQSLANSDFHKNLGKIIHDIYLTGHNLFKDMPQGEKLNEFSQFLQQMHLQKATTATNVVVCSKQNIFLCHNCSIV